ncbi:MAG TPA: hypothetical protein DDW94_06480 [Deltaproteobacteria bacterium]|nr:MAG: hypothetical protein A2Z79_01010 [Deltaproteobacteria bacterium GWA2_55_82]OGQ64242.1 MAG: hypothetical protein A3I81_12915 [Deltaproteobacteria bacterium RIFCSPLOWO2_02_FULL_55_12]OIJ74017.1 MAG: hypothetical protein A2V21_306920 [Deltaproteobacteria bacterium GWC2_55_46]HBG46623.1 hypothetical protein [Deltaproteobacteria bacterium]HCY11369.1 hypothetical protein [Deltaproteobacteria bacterium]
MKKALWVCFSVTLFLFFIFTADSKADEAVQQAPTDPDQAKEALKGEHHTPVSTDARRGGLLLPQGKFALDLGLSYAHFSESQIYVDGFALLPVLVIGEVTVEKIKRDIFIISPTGKVGITDRVQLELTVPYRYQRESFFRPDVAVGEDEVINYDQGKGDIYGTVLVHALQETATMPHLLAGLTFKSRTGQSVFEIDPTKGEMPMGTGFNSLKGTLSFIKSSDPAVVFLNLGYTHSFPRKNTLFVAEQDPDTQEIVYVSRQLKLSPGDAYEFGFGAAYALSYRLSVNMQYQHSLTLETQKDGERIAGSLINASSIRLGGNWAWSDKLSIDLSTTFGLTSDAPDDVLELRLSFH